MAVILRFFFDRSSFYIYLVIGIIQVVVFLMLILSSRTQSQKKSKTTLMSAGIIGIILSVLYFCLPETFCTPPDYPFEGICLVSRMIQSLVYILPILISLGIPLLLVGLWNKAEYGIILMISGIVWIVAFIGFFLQESFLMPFIEIPNIVSLILALFQFPAAILMAIHGIKNRDKYIIIAGSIYIFAPLIGTFIGTMFLT